VAGATTVESDPREESTMKMRLFILCATMATAVGVLPASAGGTLPGDTSTAFWPYETGVAMGTSETYVEVRADGSYYDPSLQRRVGRAASAARARPLAPGVWCPDGVGQPCQGPGESPRLEPGQVRPKFVPALTRNAYGRQAWRSGGWMME
jgi:hypothetical protein